MLRAVLLAGLLCATPVLAAAPATAAHATPAAPRAHDELLRAVELGKQGKVPEALAIVDPILNAHPTATKVRLLRAKLRVKAKDFDGAEEDLAQVAKEAPDNQPVKALLAEVRTHITPRSVTVIGGAQTYSEWVWSWKCPADKKFELVEYKGGSGHTLFYWPAKPGDPSETARFDADAGDQLYFLRVIELKAPDPAGGVKALPWMVLMDPTGAQVASGAPADVQPKLDEIKKVAKAAKATAAKVDPVSKQDFSTDTNVEGLAVRGTTTVVMLLSDG